MKKSILVRNNKGRGRPKREDGVDPMISTRFPKLIVEAIESWALKSELGRSEAIRRLVELGLNAHTPESKAVKRLRERVAGAAELAAKAVDSLTVGAADADEKASRKRRKAKGK